MRETLLALALTVAFYGPRLHGQLLWLGFVLSLVDTAWIAHRDARHATSRRL